MSYFTYSPTSLHINIYKNDGARVGVDGAHLYQAALVLNGVQVEHGYGPDQEYALRDLWRAVQPHVEVRDHTVTKVRVRDLATNERFAYDGAVYRVTTLNPTYIETRSEQFSAYRDFYDPATAFASGEPSWDLIVELVPS